MAASSDTHTRILDGALSALARRGVRKLSMSDVGAEAGISRGTLYRYFRDKGNCSTQLPATSKAPFRSNSAPPSRSGLTCRTESVWWSSRLCTSATLIPKLCK